MTADLHDAYFGLAASNPRFAGVAPVGDGGGIGAAGDLHALLDGPAGRGPGLGEHLGRLGLQLGPGLAHVHQVGEAGGGHQERALLHHAIEHGVGGEEAVLDAVDPGVEGGGEGGVAHAVHGDLAAGPVALVDDGPQQGEPSAAILLGQPRDLVLDRLSRLALDETHAGHVDDGQDRRRREAEQAEIDQRQPKGRGAKRPCPEHAGYTPLRGWYESGDG